MWSDLVGSAGNGPLLVGSGLTFLFSVCVLHRQAFRGCLGAFSSICNILRSLCLTVASSAALRRCIVTDETVGAAATITIWSNGSMKRKHLFQQHDAPIQMVSTWGKWHISAGFWSERCYHFSGEVILTFFGLWAPVIGLLRCWSGSTFWFSGSSGGLTCSSLYLSANGGFADNFHKDVPVLWCTSSEWSH